MVEETRPDRKSKTTPLRKSEKGWEGKEAHHEKDQLIITSLKRICEQSQKVDKVSLSLILCLMMI